MYNFKPINKVMKIQQCSAGTSHSSPQNLGILCSHLSLLGNVLGKPKIFEKSQKAYIFSKIWFISYQWSHRQISEQWSCHWICPSWSRQTDDYNQDNFQALSIIKVGSISSPTEFEFQSILPGNDTNLLALQETLLGYISNMPGNFSIFFNGLLNGSSQMTNKT